LSKDIIKIQDAIIDMYTIENNEDQQAKLYEIVENKNKKR